MKDTMDKVKKQLVDWEKIFSTFRGQKRLIHRKQGIPLNQFKIKSPIEKEFGKKITGKLHKMRHKKAKNTWRDD